MEDPWPGAFLQVTVRTRMHPHACLGWMKHLLLWEESKRFMETARLAKGPAGGVDPKALYSRGCSRPISHPSSHLIRTMVSEAGHFTNMKSAAQISDSPKKTQPARETRGPGLRPGSFPRHQMAKQERVTR